MNGSISQLPHDTAREAVDDQGRLIDDVACRQCGYNLRSLETDAVCPECGAAVAISIHGYYLRFAPLDWVRRLALGAKLLIASIATAIVGWVTMMGILITMPMAQSASANGPSPTFFFIIAATAIGLLLVITGLLIAGIILLTARDPAEFGKPEQFGSRRLARCCLWPIPVALVGGGAMSALSNTTLLPLMTPLLITMWIVIGIAWVASYLIMPAAMLRRFMGLMKRIPRPGLVTFAKIEFWAYLVVAVLGFGAYAVMIGMAVSTTARFAAATTVTTTAPTAALSRLGYVGGPSSAPAVTTGPIGAAGSSVTTSSFQSATRVPVTGPGLTTMPTTMPFAQASVGMAWAIIVAAAGVLGGCGGIGVGIAGLVFLIMSWRALAAAAGQAKDNSAATSRAPVPPA